MNPMQFYPGKIVRTERLAKDVVQFRLEPRADIKLDYYPGQHIVLQMEINGQLHRRPYALMSSPFVEEPLLLVIKKIKKGILSSLLFENDSEMEINFSDAQGFFYVDINSEKRQNYFLFAQDIGIIPIYSIIKSILAAESLSKVHLFYECHSRDNVILSKELDVLQSDFRNRFHIDYTLADSTILPRLTARYGQKGKINTERASNFLSSYNAEESDEFFICGQDVLINEVKIALNTFNIPNKNIHTESFFLSQIINPAPVTDNKPVAIQIAESDTVCSGSNQYTILQSLINGAFDPPYACQSGLCGTCAARLLEGQVAMDQSNALHEEDIKNGWILTCQARPLSDTIKLKFE